MPDGLPPPPRYLTPPSPDDPAILEPIRRSQPEEIHGLAWTTPDFSAPGHKIIRTFSIASKKRPGGEYIRCAICSGDHPKFLDGAVIWSPDGNLRLIGHECAAKPEHFGVAGYRSLRKQREQEELDSVALTWLHANTAEAKSLVSTLQALRTCALHLEEQRRLFFRNVGDLANLLANRARQYGGSLTVSEELSGAQLMNDASGAKQSLYEDMLVGTMLGLEFLAQPRVLRSRRLEGNLEALALIPDGEGEQPIYALIDEGGEHKITVVAGAVFRALQLALKLADECENAAQFFGSGNLTVLQRWGEDHRNTIRFTIRRNAKNTEFMLADRSRAVIPADWPRPPDLTPLRRIVAAGIQLDKLLPP